MVVRSDEYFRGLNYSLANEDTFIEYRLLPEGLDDVLAVAGSGARVLPLLAKNPKKLVAVDLSQEQLFLSELRLASVRALSYEEFLYFWGYRGALADGKPHSWISRSNLFERLHLSKPTREFFQKSKKIWEPKGFLFLGRWESHFQTLRSYFVKFLGGRFEPIFESQNLSEQKEAFQRYFPHRRFHFFCKLAASRLVFNCLYKGHFSGNQSQLDPSEFIETQFRKVFENQLVRKNFFFQILFLGKIQYEEGLPCEAHREVFEATQKSKTEVFFVKEDLVKILSQESFQFYSLSDVISYLPDQVGKSLLELISKNGKKGARVIIRSFMRSPRNLDSKGWTQLKDQEKEALDHECVPVYKFHIYQKNEF